MGRRKLRDKAKTRGALPPVTALTPFFSPFLKQPHDARSLGIELEVAYPFHPLFGQTAIVEGDLLHNGSRHLTLRSGTGRSYLIPAWMIDPESASTKIVDVPSISISALLDLRRLLDSVLASHLRRNIREGGADGQASDEHAGGSVRKSNPRSDEDARTGSTQQGAGATPIASRRSNGAVGKRRGAEK